LTKTGISTTDENTSIEDNDDDIENENVIPENYIVLNI
jgi:hypothetical protein